MAGSYGKGMFSLLKTASLLPKWVHLFPFPPVMNGSSLCSAFLPTFDDVSALCFGHSNRSVLAHSMLFW